MSARRNFNQRRIAESRIDQFSKEATALRGLASTSDVFRQRTKPTFSVVEPNNRTNQTLKSNDVHMIGSPSSEKYFDLREQGYYPREQDYDPRDPDDDEFDSREQGYDPREQDYYPQEPDDDDIDSREQDYDPRDPNFDSQEQGYDSRKQSHAPRDSEDDLDDFDSLEQGYDLHEQDCDGYYTTENENESEIDECEESESDGNESPIETEFIPSFRKGAKKNCHGPYFPNYTAAAMSLFLLTAKLSTKSFNLVRILSHHRLPRSYHRS